MIKSSFYFKKWYNIKGGKMRIQYNKYKIENNKNINIKIAHISDIHFAHKYNIKRLEMIKNKIEKYIENYKSSKYMKAFILGKTEDFEELKGKQVNNEFTINYVKIEK